MDALSALAGIVAGGTSSVAGVLKLSSPNWLADASALGVGRRLAQPVPFVEITLGALVAVGLANPWSQIAMVTLILGFSLVILRAMGRDEVPVCACFGSFDRRPVGVGHLARNALLIALTVAAATG